MWLKNCTDVVKNWVSQTFFKPIPPCTKLCFLPFGLAHARQKIKNISLLASGGVAGGSAARCDHFLWDPRAACRTPGNPTWLRNPELNGDANRGRILGNCPASHGADCRRVIGSRLFQLIWFCFARSLDWTEPIIHGRVLYKQIQLCEIIAIKNCRILRS